MKKSIYLYYILIVVCVIRIFVICDIDLYWCKDVYFRPKQTKVKVIEDIRKSSIELTSQYFESPHTELILGMTLGIDKFNKLRHFKAVLKETGTLHIVVVSGYNISLVFNLIIRLLGSRFRIRNLILALSCTFFYSVLSGFEPPVFRAWIMGSLIALGRFFGRSIDVIKVIYFTVLVMIIYDPRYLFNLSFQLSVLATLGLVMYSESFTDKIIKIVGIRNILIEDLGATLSAQVLIWPLLSYKFGELSMLSPIINSLVLWTVPLSTILGGLFLAFGHFSNFLGQLLATVAYVPLQIFTLVVNYFSKYEFCSVPLKINFLVMIIYYALIILMMKKQRY